MGFGKSKFFAKKIVIDGMKFDSKKEYEYWLELQEKQEAGEITQLERQVKHIILDRIPKVQRAIFYVADFQFYDRDGILHVQDVKSPYTAKDNVFNIKKKLFRYKYGFDIEVII